MYSIINIIKEVIVEMLNKAIIEDVLNAAISTGGDFAEIYVENRYDTVIQMMSGNVEKSLGGRDFGVGIRIFKGLNSVYTYTNDASKENLVRLAKDAAKSIGDLDPTVRFDLVKEDVKNIHKIKVLPQNVRKTDKVAMMQKGYQAANNYSDMIKQVSLTYLDNHREVMIANTEGTWVEDSRTRVRYMVDSVAEKDGKMQSGRKGKGAHIGFELFDQIDVEWIGQEASRIATTMIDAKPAPSGKYAVILENEFGGVIFHEACGHGLEATSVAKGNSVYAGKLGEKIASDVVSAVDDGTILNGWGSLNVDDEGTKASRNLLIENGVLKNYMVDKLNGRRMKMDPTGSARRENYKFAPTSRMTNTYILNGESSLDDMLNTTEYGLYAKYLGGGSVNPATGDFNFAVMEGYMIRDGKLAEPVKGATLIGTGLEVLQKIEQVGTNFDAGEGMCGSSSGSIPAGLGQPALKVSEITVGGRKEE